MPNSPSSPPTDVSTALITWLELDMSMKMLLVGVTRFVMTTMRPFFSTMNSRCVAPEGDVMQIGFVNAIEGNAFANTYAADAFEIPTPNAIPSTQKRKYAILPRHRSRAPPQSQSGGLPVVTVARALNV